MLKKIVRYGNSNAIILDKAILELLEIEEGSVVKIRTDGASLIITPQQKVAALKVQETFTHEQAALQASVQEYFKNYTGLESGRKQQLEAEYLELVKKFQDLHHSLSKNQDYVQEVTALRNQFESPFDLMKACKVVSNKYAPEIAKVEEELSAFAHKHGLVTSPYTQPSPEDIKSMEQDYLALHKKNHEVYKKYADLQNSPEYQHEAQLIAEKYGTDKNSAEYTQAMDALRDIYLPEFKMVQDEAKAIALKYNDKALNK